MAKVSLTFPLTNSIGDYSIYQMEGVNKLILRAKGGPSKEQIANDPQFERFRKCQSEFSGAGKASGLIMNTTKALNSLADHAYCGMLSKVCKIIQKQETDAEPGKRPILFSKYGKFLEGMNFNERKVIDTVLKQLPRYTILRDEHKATVYFSELFPGVNLFNPWNYPVYRFIITLGVLQDMELTANGYKVTNPAIILNRTQVITDWNFSNQALSAASYGLVLADNTILDAGSSLVLAMGVQFGRIISNSITEMAKKAGCAKILAVG